eukprot:TRINITY_DN2146_c0_g1_i1.p1 TRINITY_DN2146_c0_g1~~TRINITY_DN2146_c0_g1_i1.p1  ORF type:complete len:688 (-),score=91.00 TRINITY_DN2146_c0_g1_i1:682-2745(-)
MMSRPGSISLNTRDDISIANEGSILSFDPPNGAYQSIGDHEDELSARHFEDEPYQLDLDPRIRMPTITSQASETTSVSLDTTTHDSESALPESLIDIFRNVIRTSTFLLLLISPALAVLFFDQDQSPKFFYSYGAITSIILGMKICWEYLKLIDGGKNSNYVVSPPAILLLASVFFDMIFSFSILIDTQTDGDRCTPFAQISQFSILASISYTSLMSLDMLLRMELSFTNHNSYLPWYHAYVILTCIPSVIFVSKYNGNDQFYVCWFEIDEGEGDKFKEKPEAEVYRMLFFNIPLVLYYFFSVIVVVLAYHRLRKSKTKSDDSWSRSFRLYSKLKEILNGLIRQTAVLGVYYIILAILYLIYQKPEDDDSGGPKNFIVRLFALWVSIKVYPSAIIWRMKMSKLNADNSITIEELALLSLAETVRLDIINSCGMCIRETAEMSAGPAVEECGRAQENDFESELHLNFRGDRSGMQIRFKSYAMRVFRHLRESEGIMTEEYINSFAPEKDIRERYSERRGGRFIYLSENSRYVVKTIGKEEKDALLRLLPEYYNYVLDNPQTLLAKYLGLHGMMMYGRKTYIVVMKNITPSTRMRKYDIKGTTDRPNEPPFMAPPRLSNLQKSYFQTLRTSQMTLKDSDFLENEMCLRFPPEEKKAFVKAVRSPFQICIKEPTHSCSSCIKPLYCSIPS